MTPKPKTEEWKEKSQTVGFWHTIPGIITAIAGLITALAGLILALHQVGFLGNPKDSPSGTNPVSDTTPLTSGKTPDSSKPNEINKSTNDEITDSSLISPKYEVVFPQGSTVTFTHWSEGVYTVLNTRVDQLSPEKLKLTLTFRLTNKGRLDLNFWDSTFRLYIDEVPRAPISNLNLVVAGQSAKEGDVVFEVPVNARQLVLQLSNIKESVDIPIRIKKVN